MVNSILHGDVMDMLKTIPDNYVNCVVTSPPYWGLRDYGHAEQIGLEKTPELYTAKMVEVFNQVKRVLKPDGTLWLNLGDSYAGSGKGAADYTMKDRNCLSQTHHNVGDTTGIFKTDSYKPKDLIGIPWMVAFALRSAGWYLRSDIIWHKPNPMPESVTDRPTKSHEYIFLMSKSSKYYYDYEAIQTPLKDISLARLSQDIQNQKGSERVPGKTNGNMKAVARPFGIVRDRLLDYDSKEKALRDNSNRGGFNKESDLPEPKPMANKKSVWTVTTKPYKDAHFATFPQELIIDCIKAGCPEGGIVLDPFMGAGTTAIVARKLKRNYIGIELNEKYIKIANKRIEKELGLIFN